MVLDDFVSYLKMIQFNVRLGFRRIQTMEGNGENVDKQRGFLPTPANIWILSAQCCVLSLVATVPLHVSK